MSTDTVFRTQIQDSTQKEEIIPSGTEPSRSDEVYVEPPFTDYETVNSKPYLVDYFELGDTWSDPQGGFPKEINKIESYIKEQIKLGELENSTKAVKDMIKKMEKLNNVDKEGRNVIKIEVIANYIEFLMKNQQVKSNIRRYNYANS